MQELMGLFSDLEDPRCGNAKRHDFMELLFIALCCVLSGGTTCVDMALFARMREDFLKKFIKMENGPPSHDTFSRLFRRLDPKGLQRCLMRFVKHLATDLPAEVVALDGKSVRRSFDKAAEKGALHLVQAFACESRLVLGQLAVAEGSNEITAIRELLMLLDLRGALVTADAMHCQRETAALICERGGHYVLACKGNQGELHEDLRLFFADAEQPFDVHEEPDGDHGRVDVRTVRVSHDVAWLRERHEWPSLAAVGCVERQWEEGGKTEKSVRYFIMSKPLTAPELARVVRAHWRIENALHWVLDVVFDEDGQRNRKDATAENLSALRRIALNLARLEPSKGSMRGKLKRAAWNENFLASLLRAAKNI